jgi:hypothetical protein
MSFAEFERSIESADLKAVAVHWNAARGASLMPSWNDIRPAAIPKQLRVLWSFAYDPGQDEFIGRIGGEAINRIFGRNIKGVKLSELSAMLNRDRMVARLKRVMQEPALVSGFSPMFSQQDQYGIGERIVLPLGADKRTGDAVLGATEYRTEGYVPSDFQKLPERENWFSLGQ